MTGNHNYNTPSQGILDWDKPINNNFRKLDTDAPLVGSEAELSNYIPKKDALFIATDTGDRYVGDGTQWVKLPLGGGNSSGSGLDIGKEDATLIIQKNGADTELASSNGRVIRSGSAQLVFDQLSNELEDGDTVYIAPGVYELFGELRYKNIADLTWRSDGIIRQNATDEVSEWLFHFVDLDNFKLLGGVYDGNRYNNPHYGDCWGCEGILRLGGGGTAEVAHLSAVRGMNWNISAAEMSGRIHHCYFSDTLERGVYLKWADWEVDHNAFINIERGDIRTRGNPSMHVHDNFHMMRGPYTYIIHRSKDWLIERETVINQDVGQIVRANFKSEEWGKIRNVTIRDSYFHGTSDGPASFDCIDCRNDADEVDEDSFTYENLTLENLPVNSPLARNQLGLE